MDSCCLEGFRSLTGLVSYVPAAADVADMPDASPTALDKHGHKTGDPDLQKQQYEFKIQNAVQILHF